jgi:hypothetical protein
VALSKEEQEQLDKLTAKAAEPDDEPDFEMEIYDGPKGARIPYRKGRSWLQENFGIDLDPDPAKETGEEDGESAAKEGSKPGKKPAKPATPDATAQRQGHWSGRIDRNSA